MNVWLFGYGSLMWRPGFPYLDRREARLRGWERRFWQGSHDHRGVPDAPGRVVTLIEADGHCDGIAFLVDAATVAGIFEQLDHREKNGYQRYDVTLHLRDEAPVVGVAYVAPRGNHAYLGPAPLADIAAQIRRSHGPSGANLDYLIELADTLRELEVHDPHVFELEAKVRSTPQ